MLAEAYLFLAKARYLKSVPFERLASSLGESFQESLEHLEGMDRKELARISQSIKIMSKYTFWESQCMVQAVAAMKMIERRGMSSTIYFGTARDDNGEMIAHAWLRSGPYYITGAEGMERFTVVGKFAKNAGGKQHGEKYTSESI
ncbi:lasso peptide biosynthesis B2 protein [Halobacillus sp. A1]|uniref:lasso peptide biosynthesis B2 protein n=1 Tax=Halobacillus sp. A1 TaxID=2880262 RepID=UPI0020A6C663|nr:lasso peptide biosynthesis B2 protein [Halobacillus sp. A1]